MDFICQWLVDVGWSGRPCMARKFKLRDNGGQDARRTAGGTPALHGV